MGQKGRDRHCYRLGAVRDNHSRGRGVIGDKFPTHPARAGDLAQFVDCYNSLDVSVARSRRGSDGDSFTTHGYASDVGLQVHACKHGSLAGSQHRRNVMPPLNIALSNEGTCHLDEFGVVHNGGECQRMLSPQLARSIRSLAHLCACQTMCCDAREGAPVNPGRRGG